MNTVTHEEMIAPKDSFENDRRYRSAVTALYALTADDISHNVIDMLTGLMLICHVRQYDWNHLLSQAENKYTGKSE